MKYHFKIHNDVDGYWGEGVELKGCLTQGDTWEELLYNLEEVLNLYLDDPSDSKFVHPFPDDSIQGEDIVSIPVYPKIAFAFYIRSLRLKYNITQQQVAEKMGIKSVYGYQKLESSKTANPTLMTLAKLKKIFPDFNLSLIL
ncbi:type II toxin-antitoxin system HicB family antitoxin [bacterium]|nr:type II toxin-antitoxin system HicB family antitoxin [bacterium]